MSGVADSKNNGLIDVEVDWGSSAVISDVIVDGATACNTLQWNGIRIMCAGAMAFPGNQPVIIRALPRILNSSTIRGAAWFNSGWCGGFAPSESSYVERSLGEVSVCYTNEVMWPKDQEKCGPSNSDAF